MAVMPATGRGIAPYSWYVYQIKSMYKGSGNGWSKSHIAFGPRRERAEGESVRFLCGRKTTKLVVLAGTKDLKPCPICLRLAAEREES